MQTIAISNHKGGCGKTTTAINLASCLAETNSEVLLVDFDPQGHATLGLKIHPDSLEKTIHHALLNFKEDPTTLSDIITPISPHLSLAPANVSLSGFEQCHAGTEGREIKLRYALQSLGQNFDYVIIDCPPSISLLTFNALMASKGVIMPIDVSFFSLHGISQLFESLELLEKEKNWRVSPMVLPTNVDARTRFAQELLEELHRHFTYILFDSVIPSSVKYREAGGYGCPINEYAPHSKACKSYRDLAEEIVRKEAEWLGPTVTSQERFLGPRPTKEGGIEFIFEDHQANEVKLAGDFNQWKAQDFIMMYDEEKKVWRKAISLKPGSYQYRYVVDGRWIADPHNPVTVDDQFGGVNSLVIVD